jgi:hypothetical protein
MSSDKKSKAEPLDNFPLERQFVRTRMAKHRLISGSRLWALEEGVGWRSRSVQKSKGVPVGRVVRVLMSSEIGSC